MHRQKGELNRNVRRSLQQDFSVKKGKQTEQMKNERWKKNRLSMSRSVCDSCVIDHLNKLPLLFCSTCIWLDESILCMRWFQIVFVDAQPKRWCRKTDNDEYNLWLSTLRSHASVWVNVCAYVHYWLMAANVEQQTAAVKNVQMMTLSVRMSVCANYSLFVWQWSTPNPS